MSDHTNVTIKPHNDYYIISGGDFNYTEFLWYDFEFKEENYLSYSYDIKKLFYSGKSNTFEDTKAEFENLLGEKIIELLTIMSNYKVDKSV